MQHHGDGASLLMGLAGVMLSKLFGWISIVGIGQAFLLGAAGAAGGWVFKRMMDLLIRKIKKKYSTKNQNKYRK